MLWCTGFFLTASGVLTCRAESVNLISLKNADTMSQIEPSGFNVSELFQTNVPPASEEVPPMRRRSNSQSQVVALSMFLQPRTNSAQPPNFGRSAGPGSLPKVSKPAKRHQAEYYVTLVPLNDTFVKKHLHVPYYPETCKLGRPTGTKIKPHFNNGYFDSRVLSRTHACMFVEPGTGQLMIQDMGSSNGTFVNQSKIGSEPVAVNIGDYINLGFNIQIETSHKQISAKIENINVVSNNPTGSVLNYLPRLTQNDINRFSASEMKHFDFIQSIFSLLLDKKEKQIEEEEQDPEAETTRAFETAMFSDIYPSLESSIASTAENNMNAGIFSNSRIVNAPNVDSTLDALMANLAMVKQQNDTLVTLEKFLKNYVAKLDEVNSSFLQTELEKRDKIHERQLQEEKEKYAALSYKQEKENSKYLTRINGLEQQILNLQETNEDLNSELQRASESYLQLRLQLNQPRSSPEPHSDSNDETYGIGEPESRERSVIDEADATEASLPCQIAEKEINTDKRDENHSNSEVDTTASLANGSEKNEKKDAYSRTEKIKSSPSFSGSENAYLSHMRHQMSQIKNQGMVLGLVVVVAGFLYQSSGK